MPIAKSVLCVSWNPSQAEVRLMMLMQAGYAVISALGREQAALHSHAKADLLVLGHSVPREEKQAVIQSFRGHSKAPILSLLKSGQEKLPEADVGVVAITATDFIRAVRQVLPANLPGGPHAR